MADDLGIGIILLEVFQQEEDGGFLGLGAGVGGAAFLIVVAAVVGVAFGAVTALQVFEREGFVAAGGAAVENVIQSF